MFVHLGKYRSERLADLGQGHMMVAEYLRGFKYWVRRGLMDVLIVVLVDWWTCWVVCQGNLPMLKLTDRR